MSFAGVRWVVCWDVDGGAKGDEWRSAGDATWARGVEGRVDFDAALALRVSCLSVS